MRHKIGIGCVIRWSSFLVVLATAIPWATAEDAFLYSLNTPGVMSVNGNKINSLPGAFDPDNPGIALPEAWRDLAIVAGSQYAIRGDGLVYLNGSKLWTLPGSNLWFWTELQVSDGTVYALRQDGRLAVDRDLVDSLPHGEFFFTGLQVKDGSVYSLRSDGAVFKNSNSTPIFTFDAGTGLLGGSDGEEDDTIWGSLKVDGPFLYALRSDGHLYRGLLPSGATDGELVEEFPFPNNVFTLGDLYMDLEFDNLTGEWVVLRGNGMVYREPNVLAESVDFPGGNSSAPFYTDLDVFDGRYFALRSDGNVYVENLADPLLSLSNAGYGRIELSAVPPNLAGQKNNAPAVVQYTIPINTDTPVHVPVIATDVETRATDLVVTPIEVPTGAEWDADTQVLDWITPAAAGNYLFSYTVSDGGSKPKTYKSTLQVKLPDTVPDQNLPPYLPKLKGAVALVGQEYRVYIPLNDPDGDTVTGSVDTSAYPFTFGAQYNALTSEFVWTPTNADIGKHTIVFTLSDGTTTKSLKLKIEVKSPLFIVPLPG